MQPSAFHLAGFAVIGDEFQELAEVVVFGAEAVEGVFYIKLWSRLNWKYREE